MPIANTVTVSNVIAPSSTADTYPVTDPTYGLGGLRTVADITARNAIPAQRRQQGMIVYVTDVSKYYILLNGILDANWAELQSIISIDGGTY